VRLFFVVPYTPTPIRTRPFHLLKYLVRNGHQLTLAALYTGKSEQASLAQWESQGVNVLAVPLTRVRSLRNIVRNLFSRVPFQASFCWQPALAKQVERALMRNTFDIIHVEHLRGARYAIAAQEFLERSNRATPVIWDSVDCITRLFEQTQQVSRQRSSRWMARVELARTRDYEKQLALRFDRTLVVSENEQKAFCALGVNDSNTEKRSAPIAVIRNGVDLDYFLPQPIARETATILFTGKMSYHANDTAARFLLDEIMPLVWEHVPHARVVIAGQGPRNDLIRRARGQTERIQVTGFVPDMRFYLARATVACAPILYGAGTQNKVLEAMACATAVVASPRAIEALATRPSQDVLMGSSARELSTQLLRVLGDAALRAQLEHNGRRYVEIHHRWENSVQDLENVYAQTIRHSSGSTGG
jgi:glycosyltransferase involved in cell wall biosynthesis